VATGFTPRLAATVRARRADLRLSQQDLADMSGVSERFVRFVEQGKPSLRLDTLLALLDTLGLELQVATRTSAAARALVTPPSELPVTQPPLIQPPSAAPPEGNEPGEGENRP
jgi:HTH-type transcriptional regulator/antitoxin HipB